MKQHVSVTDNINNKIITVVETEDIIFRLSIDKYNVNKKLSKNEYDLKYSIKNKKDE